MAELYDYRQENKNLKKRRKGKLRGCFALKMDIDKLREAVQALKKAAEGEEEESDEQLEEGEEEEGEEAGGSASVEDEENPSEGQLAVVDEKPGASSGPSVDLDDCEPTSSKARPLTQIEKLRRLVLEMQSDVARPDADVALCEKKMDRVNKLWNDCVVDEMRHALTGYRMRDKSGLSVETLSGDELNDANLVKAMNGDNIREFKLNEFCRKPEQPKGCSRATWLEHLKMGKKFAECIAHLVYVHQMGCDVEKMDWPMTDEALAVVELWMHKYDYRKYSLMPAVHYMVAYEIIRRVKDYEYFICTFCNTVDFNVRQFLAHFSSGGHCSRGRKIIDMDGRVAGIGFISKHLLNMTMICEELHGYYSKLFTSPLVRSGARVPSASPDSIPTDDYLKELEEKYGQAINGDLDTARLDDAIYVASQLSAVVQRHKGPIGQQLFAELDEYFGKGTTIYCRRCHWKVSNKASYYRHVMNPYHMDMSYLADGRQFHLITVSINIHLRDDFGI